MSKPSPFVAALKANLAPALILWTGAAALLYCYYQVAAARDALDGLAQLKAQSGLAFVIPFQILAAAILPFLFQKLQRGAHQRTRLADVPYLCFFWAIEGALVDRFYALQAQLFGNGVDVVTVLIKTGTDMFISNPLFWTPLIVSVMAFKDARYSVALWRRDYNRTWYRRRVVPVLIASWTIWTPAIAVLYALPQALQFPFQSLVLCFWALILVVMTGHKKAATPVEA